MIRYTRWALTVLVVPPLVVFFGALFQTQIERFASGRQFDLFLTRWVLTLSESTHYLVGVEWFWFAFGLVAGAAAALWIVEWASRSRQNLGSESRDPHEGGLS